MEESPAVVESILVDRAGYAITVDDLTFLGLTENAVRAMTAREYPLGMTGDTYEEFTRTLLEALRDEGADSADVRIQGSSVRFFSGAHKRMLWDRNELEDEYVNENANVPLPSALALSRMKSVLHGQWPDPSSRPEARPFDVFYRAGVHLSPSDYDVQISSSHLVGKVYEQMRRRGVDPDRARAHNKHYEFVEKRYAGGLAYLAVWQATSSELVGRPVTIALFDQDGPPDATTQIGDLSSHFRDTDWLITDEMMDA